MKENLIEYFIIFATFIFLIFLFIERTLQIKNRRKIKHVIYVNGTRGKSSVTRMIDSGLREHGYRVLSKTTGTLPIILHVNGTSEEIKRKAPANIREQLRILNLAVKEKADILVIECMALSPENQYVSQHRMLNADIGVLTNVRLDHTDVMGKTKEEILYTLLNTMPKNGIFITSEEELFPLILKKGEKLNTKCFLSKVEKEDMGIDFDENVSLSRTVCEYIGVNKDIAIRGIKKYKRDPYSKEVLLLGKTIFINALSANDIESTLIIANEINSSQAFKNKVLVINNRYDRPERALSMCNLAKKWNPNEIYLIGDNPMALKLWFKRNLNNTVVSIFKNVDDIPFTTEIETLMLAVGNIKGPGILLTEKTRKLVKKEI